MREDCDQRPRGWYEVVSGHSEQAADRLRINGEEGHVWTEVSE